MTAVVKGAFGKGDEYVPLGGGQRNMGGGEDGNEMVFSGPDGPFGLVSPVVGGRDVLNLDGGGDWRKKLDSSSLVSLSITR
jgi:hypothetical protein